jgi:N,N'-diacetyllegionaminate synthase
MGNLKKIKIIAEAAQGFEGDPLLARLLVRAAGRAGADAVKFQLVYADEIATPEYKYYDLFKKLEMPAACWREVASEAKKEGIGLYFDIFGKNSLRMALALGAEGLKIHATDFYHDALLSSALDSRKNILISCGGIMEEELVGLFKRHPRIRQSRVSFMHGFQAEPTPLSANNLLRLGALAALCQPAGIGFMDHSDGATEDSLNLSLLALPFGIQALEKHITLDRELRLEDYISALPPAYFKKFVKKIRKYGQALGASALEPGSDEKMYRSKSAKIVVAARKLKKGNLLRKGDLKLLRVDKQETLPAIYDPNEVLGSRVSRKIPQHHPIFKRFLYKK